MGPWYMKHLKCINDSDRGYSIYQSLLCQRKRAKEQMVTFKLQNKLTTN